MGCTHSKVDDLPAVALCRERCGFLDEAVKQRYAFAEAHFAYLSSLKSIGFSFQRFFEHHEGDLLHSVAAASSPPHNHRKSDPQPSVSLPPPAAAAATVSSQQQHHHLHSHSNSGSHLHFHSDSEEDDEDDSAASGSLHHHSGTSSPLHHHHNDHHHLDPPSYGHMGYGQPDHETLGFGGGFMQMNFMKSQGTKATIVYEQRPVSPETVQMGGGFVQVNYMRSQATPAVVYEQRPMSPENVHMGGGGGGSSAPGYYPYANYQNDTSYPYYNYSNFPSGFSGSSSQQMTYGSSIPSSGGASTSKAPPPPPSPPRASAWEFLNPFESYEKDYPSYTPSRDSREVREEEGIPELEDEDYQPEVVKEVHVDQKHVDASRGSHSTDGDKAGKGIHEDSVYSSRPRVSTESDPVEYEVHMVDKKVVNDEKRSGDQANVGGFKARKGFKGDIEVIREIQVQFERASESGNDLATLLEVGKLPYNRKHSAYQVPSKMFHAITPSLPSTSKSPEIEKAGPAYLDVDEELDLRSRSLSSTLHKLYLWEKKLYEEVKAEEKMRVLHERKNRKLKRLDEKGAEAQKIDATRTLVRSLSTKIRIAIQVVDKISVKINILRDEDLWPMLNESIHGLCRMWKGMLECHHNQCQAIAEAKHLDAIAFRNNFSDSHLEATLQLEHELLNWITRFSTWVSGQKLYVRALNSWLVKCLLYVPEETPDGIVPFSPGRIGAPPVFIVCNQWAQSLDRVSEKEVLDYMRDFASNVLQLWDRDKLEMRQKMLMNKDMERKVKNLEREDQKIQKEIQALDKRMILTFGDDSGLAVSRPVVYQSDATKSGSLQVGLQRIFEAMERFASNSLKVYEELLQRIEEDNLARDH